MRDGHEEARVLLTVGQLTEPLTGRRWDAPAVTREVSARSARYRRRGLRPGDRVLLHFGNRLEFFAELLAVWRLGRLRGPDRRPADRASSSSASPDGLAPLLGGGRRHRRRARRALPPPADVLDATETAHRPTTVCRRSARGLDDDALILFTSGTTGKPKGVVHTHRSLRARWMASQRHLGLAAYARTLCLLPTHFGHGLICNCLFPWLAGQDLFILPPFKPDLLLRLGALIDEHRITFLSSVPPIWRLALKLAPPAARRHAACASTVGSAPLSATLWEDIRAGRARRRCSTPTASPRPAAGSPARRCGDFTPEDGLDRRALGRDDRDPPRRRPDAPLRPDADCAPGEAGYVWLKTPALMRGYLDRDDLTAQVVQRGWFLTGDIGLLDERGRLHLRGRERDEINKGGIKIYPADVDAVVEGCRRVSDVCAFAVDDPLYGQNVGLAVVLTDARTPPFASSTSWMRERLAEHKMPVRWCLLDAIPRSARGKVNREAVKEACASRAPLDLARILQGALSAPAPPRAACSGSCARSSGPTARSTASRRTTAWSSSG